MIVLVKFKNLFDTLRCASMSFILDSKIFVLIWKKNSKKKNIHIFKREWKRERDKRAKENLCVWMCDSKIVREIDEKF